MTVIIIITGIIVVSLGALLWYYGVTVRHVFEGCLEALIVFFFSNLPIVLLIYSAFGDDPAFRFSLSSVVEFIAQSNVNGESFIYTAALLAPVVYMLIRYTPDTHRILNGIYLALIVTIFVFSAFTFQEVRLGDPGDLQFLRLSALVLYLVSLALWIGALIYQRAIQDVPRSDANSGGQGIVRRL